jgi:D-amino-acid dehydrogenase
MGAMDLNASAPRAWEAEPPPDATVLVIGAGIIGAATSIVLLRRGFKVLLVDPTPGEGTTFGSGGLFSVDTMTPLAFPGMLRSVVGWLTDAQGPLRIRPSYFPRAMPWLLAVLRESRPDRVQRSAAALRALHRDSYDRYRELLGAELFARHIRDTGSVQVWDTDTIGTSEAAARSLRETHGVEVEPLDLDRLREMFPGIGPAVRRGELFRRQVHTPNPGALVKQLCDLFLREGGQIARQRVSKILPREGGHYMAFTNAANLFARRVVVAAGPWSSELLRTVGYRLPLDVERGYHVMLENPSIQLRYPILHRGKGFGMTPMEDGLRIAGTVEIAGLHAPPDESRALLLRRHAQALFPDLTGTTRRLWLGLRPTLPDSLPAIGPVPGQRGLYVAAGHNHYGVVGGATSARLIGELIAGDPPHIDPAPYLPARFA